MQPIETTLVVAATRSMGIGAKGTLPWTGLKKEMAYFARVTKRPPAHAPTDALNAVIMGRKTWESIPPKFRPLKGRLNIVISRSFPAPADDTGSPECGPVKAASLEQALDYLGGKTPAELGKVFVIGGAQIYAAALRMKQARRILFTRVLTDFECDTFFPINLSGEDGESAWAKRTKGELEAWVGESVPEGTQVENGTEYEWEMWERPE